MFSPSKKNKKKGSYIIIGRVGGREKTQVVQRCRLDRTIREKCAGK